MVAALQHWGEPYGFVQWSQEPVAGVGAPQLRVWRVQHRYGVLRIRFTVLLAKRSLADALIAELDSHCVGRRARIGHWYVHALSQGRKVEITFREEVSMELSQDDRAWLR